MERKELATLFEWKSSKNRKPLIVKGARQVGKTWLIKFFGQQAYQKVVYINFETASHLKGLFAEDLNTSRIIRALQIEAGFEITPGDTLIIFDEIQSAPEALHSLKYFCENTPDLHIVAAGSLLGVALHADVSFPVGKVDFMDLYPLSFQEFLRALGENSLASLLDSDDWPLISTFRNRYIELLRTYYFVGGMPEVVFTFGERHDYPAARKIQQQILYAWEQDFSKHPPADVIPRIRMVWNAIPSQLAKENRKFIYGAMKPGARARDYELALQWLIDCGLVYRINRISMPGFPLKGYEDFSAFKLFIVDTGILGAMGNLDPEILLKGDALFREFKGALTEQYVLQQLISRANMPIAYWSAERSDAEIDFVIQQKNQIIPIEVKAEENLKSKSLKSYCMRWSPQTAIRTSMSDYRKESWFTNLPLYAVHRL
jgi:uncharacterized protein